MERVTVSLERAEPHEHRLELSAGTLRGPDETAGPPYEPDARIPAGPWRQPTDDERRQLVGGAARRHRGTTIAVTSVPADLLGPFAILRDAARSTSDRSTVARLLGTPDCVRGVQRVVACLRRCAAPPTPDHDALEGGIVAHAPRLETVTVDPRNGRRVGLHLDDWHRVPLDQRQESPNRICINLGCEDRFLLFFDITIDAVCNAARVAGSTASFEQHGGTAVGRSFMTLLPSYPVARLRIRPGEAYIAPTENLLHDGSSAGMSGVDISLSLRGRFEVDTRIFLEGASCQT